MNEKLRKIINYYGIKKQLKYFQSEIFELNEAILVERNTGCLENVIETVVNAVSHIQGLEHISYKREHIKEEIADVMVMLKQFQLYYDISSKEIHEVMKYKVDRTLERIGKEVSNSDDK